MKNRPSATRVYVALSTLSNPQPNLYVFDENGVQQGAPLTNGAQDSSHADKSLRLSGDGTRAVGLTFKSGSFLSLSSVP